MAHQCEKTQSESSGECNKGSDCRPFCQPHPAYVVIQGKQRSPHRHPLDNDRKIRAANPQLQRKCALAADGMPTMSKWQFAENQGRSHTTPCKLWNGCRRLPAASAWYSAPAGAVFSSFTETRQPLGEYPAPRTHRMPLLRRLYPEWPGLFPLLKWALRRANPLVVSTGAWSG